MPLSVIEAMPAGVLLSHRIGGALGTYRDGSGFWRADEQASQEHLKSLGTANCTRKNGPGSRCRIRRRIPPTRLVCSKTRKIRVTAHKDARRADAGTLSRASWVERVALAPNHYLLTVPGYSAADAIVGREQRKESKTVLCWRVVLVKSARRLFSGSRSLDLECWSSSTIAPLRGGTLTVQGNVTARRVLISTITPISGGVLTITEF
jgi:hypothetical protein